MTKIWRSHLEGMANPTRIILQLTFIYAFDEERGRCIEAILHFLTFALISLRTMQLGHLQTTGIMHLMGGLDRCIDRYTGRKIGQYIGHHSIDVSTDTSTHYHLYMFYCVPVTFVLLQFLFWSKY